jgi:hypothetical protein
MEFTWVKNDLGFETHSQGLKAYKEALRELQKRYESTDNILRCVQQLVHKMTIDESVSLLATRYMDDNERICNPRFTMLADTASAAALRTTSWADLITQQPRAYLTVAISVDLSVSHGQLPSGTEVHALFKTLRRKG